MHKNRGSIIVEASLLMPIIISVYFLMIGMILYVYHGVAVKAITEETAIKVLECIKNKSDYKSGEIDYSSLTQSEVFSILSSKELLKKEIEIELEQKLKDVLFYLGEVEAKVTFSPIEYQIEVNTEVLWLQSSLWNKKFIIEEKVKKRIDQSLELLRESMKSE